MRDITSLLLYYYYYYNDKTTLTRSHSARETHLHAIRPTDSGDSMHDVTPPQKVKVVTPKISEAPYVHNRAK